MVSAMAVNGVSVDTNGNHGVHPAARGMLVRVRDRDASLQRAAGRAMQRAAGIAAAAMNGWKSGRKTKTTNMFLSTTASSDTISP